MDDAGGPLGRYVVLDLTGLVGQFAGKILADLGLDVIKVEPVSGDEVRRRGPFKAGDPDSEGSLTFAYLNGGKKSISLDIEHPEGRELLARLIRRADVLLESFSPGDAERLGLGEAELRDLNPGLVTVSITGFGKVGLRSSQLAPDIVTLATGGILNMSGDPNLPPCKPPEQQSYYFAGAYAAMAVLACLWGREADGLGDWADVSVQEAVAVQEHLIRAWANDGQNIPRYGSQHRVIAPASIFPTNDGFVSLYVSFEHWPAFLSIWKNHPADLDDAEWRSNLKRRQDADRINALVSAFSSSYSTADFVDMLQGSGIPCLPVNSPRDFLDDPHIKARGVFQPVTHPVLGTYLSMSFPAVHDGTRLPVSPPPRLGEHTDAVLAGMLDLDPLDLELLFARRVI